jgi:hypothetical protein
VEAHGAAGTLRLKAHKFLSLFLFLSGCCADKQFIGADWRWVHFEVKLGFARLGLG